MLLSVILLVAIILLIANVYYRNYYKFFKALNQIPGPENLPIIGNLLDILQPQDQHFKNYRKRALKYFPIFREKIVHMGIVNLLLPEDIELLLSNTQYIQKSLIYKALHPWLGDGLLTSNGRKWQNHRKILTPAFHFSILQKFVEIFNKSTNRLIMGIAATMEESYIDVIPIISEFTLHAIMETSMGVELNSSKSSKNYKMAVYEFGETAYHRIVRPWLIDDKLFNLTPTGRKSQKAVKILHDFSKLVINERRKSIDYGKKPRTLLDLLLTAEKDGAAIDDKGIREEVDTFMFEGHDTTSIALSFMFLLLANHQDVQETIHEEIVEILGNGAKLPTYHDLQNLNYTERCLKECLRLYPSVPFIARDATTDIHTVSGYTIPKGAMVHVHIYDLHHNPRIYPDPDKFDPDRFLPMNVQKRHPFAYLPFSAGSRNCIGQRFAMLELKAALCGVLRQFRLEPVDKVEDVVFCTELVLRTKEGIKVKFVKRK